MFDKDSPGLAKRLDLPVLGICYGQKLITYLLDGKAVPADNMEYGETKVRIENDNPLIRDILEGNLKLTRNRYCK